MKYLAKKLLTPILASRPVSTLATRLFGYGIPVFMLHRMVSNGESNMGRTTPDHLRRCLQYLVDNGYTFISLEHLILALRDKQALPPKAVVFTMDDGFADQAEIAAPIFLEFDCPVTFFVITGMLDQTMWPWDTQVSWIIETSKKATMEAGIAGETLSLNLENTLNRRMARRSVQDTLKRLDAGLIPDILINLAREAGVSVPGQAPAPYLPMSWESARQLEHKGIQFAPHSITHNILSRLSKEALEYEIDGSWKTLNAELDNPLKVFCYPSGRTIDFGTREIDTLKNRGFLGAAATTPEAVGLKNDPGEQIFCLPRFALPESMTDFIHYCTWIEYAKNAHFKYAVSK